MLISHSHKFIFFHIIKTGGTSVTETLLRNIHCDIGLNIPRSYIAEKLFNTIEEKLSNTSKYCELGFYEKAIFKLIYSLDSKRNYKIDDDVKRIIDKPYKYVDIYNSYYNENYPPLFSKIGAHENVINVYKTIPEDIFNSYFKFVFVRNPYSWLVSIYHYFRQVNYTNLANINNYFRKFNSFDEFIDQYIELASEKNEEEYFYGMNILYPQKSFITNNNGEIMVDYVGKLETIPEDLEIIFKRLNISPEKISHANKSTHKPYLEYYSDKNLERIRDLLKVEFEFLGYD